MFCSERRLISFVLMCESLEMYHKTAVTVFFETIGQNESPVKRQLFVLGLFLAADLDTFGAQLSNLHQQDAE